MLITLDNSVLYTALPTLTKDLGATDSQALWIINAYPLVMAGLLLGAGTLGDRVGHRKMFLVGLVVFGIASLAAAFSPTPEALIAARAFLAVGAAAMMPATLALIRVSFEDERERNLAIAVWACMSIVGAALGPIIGGLMLSHFWWGSVFLINIPVVLIAIVSTLIVAPSARTGSSQPWDLISSLQGLVALSGLVMFIKYSANSAPSWQISVPSLLVAIAAGILFTRRQNRLPYPLLDFSIFKNAAFSAGVITAAASMFTLAGVQLITTQRFQLIADYSPLQAGMLVSAIAIGCLPTMLIGGAFLHRIGLRWLLGGGLLFSILGLGTAAYGLNREIEWVIAGMLLIGAGLGGAMAGASTAIMGNAPASRAGMAASVEEVSYEFGGLFAVALLGSLLSAIYFSSVNLPAGIPENARHSVVAAVEIARSPGEEAPELLRAIAIAFDRGYLVVMSVVAAVLFSGAITMFFLLKRYDPGSPASAHASH